jgi:hypothetical protein
MSVKSLSDLDGKRGGAALKARIRHIDDRLIWFGFVRLSAHVAKFGISEVQGKIDLQTYRNLSSTPPPERKPGRSATSGAVLAGPGIYERPDPFAPVFEGARSLDDLMETKLSDAGAVTSLTIEKISIPHRSVDADNVRAVLAAAELRESCSIAYQSMTSTESSERAISPHALVKASGRWHVRAYDFSRKRFVDFSLSRVRFSASANGHTVVPGEIDDDWQTAVTIAFVPHPSLSENQRDAVAREFGMTGETLMVTVRRALLFYLLDEMRILNAVRSRDVKLAQAASIWVQDLDSVCAELNRMDMRDVELGRTPTPA